MWCLVVMSTRVLDTVPVYSGRSRQPSPLSTASPLMAFGVARGKGAYRHGRTRAFLEWGLGRVCIWGWSSGCYLLEMGVCLLKWHLEKSSRWGFGAEGQLLPSLDSISPSVSGRATSRGL